jgi:hypothetical protein
LKFFRALQDQLDVGGSPPAAVTLLFALVRSRTVFALPFALPANWIFRITAVRRPASYFSAVRKTLFTLSAVPVLLLCGVGYLSIWPSRPALAHLCVLFVIAILLVQVLLRKFRKIRLPARIFRANRIFV